MKSVGPLKMVDHKTMNSEAEKWLKDVKMNFDPKGKTGNIVNWTDAVSRDRKGSQEAREDRDPG